MTDKACPYHFGPVAFSRLNECAMQINSAFGDYGCYLVGSSTERPDYRDVDVRFIMEDGEYDKMFPAQSADIDRLDHQFNAKWTLICTLVSEWMSARSGLPVDFQIQKQTRANAKFKGRPRNALGIVYGRLGDDTP